MSYSGDGRTHQVEWRDIWVGSVQAAKVVGIGRTQAWRLGKKWASQWEEWNKAVAYGLVDLWGVEQPPVRVLRMGSEDVLDTQGRIMEIGRPEYKFHLDDLRVYADARHVKKSKARTKKAKRAMDRLLALMKSQGTTLEEAIEPLIAEQNRQNAMRRRSESLRVVEPTSLLESSSE